MLVGGGMYRRGDERVGRGGFKGRSWGDNPQTEKKTNALPPPDTTPTNKKQQQKNKQTKNIQQHHVLCMAYRGLVKEKLYTLKK